MDEYVRQFDRDPRSAWIELITRAPPPDLFLTIGFNTWLSPANGSATLEHFLGRLCRFVGGKRWRRATHLAGVVVAERKRLSRLAPSSLHYHCLLRFVPSVPEQFDLPQLRAACERHAARLRRPTWNRHQALGQPISGADLVDIQLIRDAAGLAHYVTKELPQQPHDVRGITIGYFGPSGVVGLAHER